ncbi:hypothetical protein GCM10027597_30330 [Saccharopolyspora tripterygii]
MLCPLEAPALDPVLFDPAFDPVLLDVVLELPRLAAVPLRCVAALPRDEPRPPLVVRLAMPHTVSAPASPVTTTTGVRALSAPRP